MCGICGVWGNVPNEAVEAMVHAMRHRGPDDRGVYRDSCVALGVTRLAVVDVSPAGHQPMQNPDGKVWIAYNGEVYNFQRERKILEAKGYPFLSSSDTEVVLRMYECYGDDFLLKLRGMFALAIYDKRRGPGRERLLLARDQLGIKPLLFAWTGGTLIFASEIKALLASGLIRPRIDPVALRLLLTFGSVYQPRTMLEGIRMLLPGHRLIIEPDRESLERYWSLGINRQFHLRKQPYEVMVEEMGRVLKESVQLQLVSDVPLGAFLSGGVDSSILVALTAKEMSHRVKTFSVGFEQEGAEIDESQDARRMADFLGTDHTHVLVKGTDVRDCIRDIAKALDQPSVDGVNSYFVSLAARQGVTVAMSGTGGDELFAGYPWFIYMIMKQRQDSRGRIPTCFKSMAANFTHSPLWDPLVLTRIGGRVEKARRWSDFLSEYSYQYQIFDPLTAARLLAPELRGAAQAGRSAHHDLIGLDELTGGTTIERVTGLCLRGYTNNQLLRDIDAVSMAHSLEVRVPYLDVDMVDMALSLPDETKLGKVEMFFGPDKKTYRETGAKRILIDIGRSLLPADFDRQPKRGFGMPFEAWLKGPLRDVFLDSLSESNLTRRGLLDVQKVLDVRKRFLEGHLSWAQPWTLMMLELWCQEVLDSPYGRG